MGEDGPSCSCWLTPNGTQNNTSVMWPMILWDKQASHAWLATISYFPSFPSCDDVFPLKSPSSLFISTFYQHPQSFSTEYLDLISLTSTCSWIWAKKALHILNWIWCARQYIELWSSGVTIAGQPLHRKWQIGEWCTPIKLSLFDKVKNL